MPAKSNKKEVIDEIASIGEQVDEPQEKVIRVRIPSKKSTSDDKDTAEKAELVTETNEKLQTKEETNETPAVEEKVTPPVSTKPEITSFSMLDKSSEDETDESKLAEDQSDSSKDEKVENPSEDEKTQNTLQKENEKPDTTEEIKKWLDETDDDAPQEESKSKMKAFLLILLLIAILGVVGGGIYFYQTRIPPVVEEEKPEPVVIIPTVSIEPTQAPTDPLTQIEAADYSLQVLNGSGVTGAANKVATIFADKGFTQVDAGNASSSSFKETEVSVKADAPEALYEAIKELLSDSYVVVKSETPLDEASKYDAVITLGSSEPDATATPTAEPTP